MNEYQTVTEKQRLTTLVSEKMQIAMQRPTPATDYETVTAAGCVQIAFDPQPFVELRPGDPKYGEAVNAAQNRIWRLQASSRYHDCPDPTLDTRDPEVAGGAISVPRSLLVEGPARWPVRDETGKPMMRETGRSPRGERRSTLTR